MLLLQFLTKTCSLRNQTISNVWNDQLRKTRWHITQRVFTIHSSMTSFPQPAVGPWHPRSFKALKCQETATDPFAIRLTSFMKWTKTWGSRHIRFVMAILELQACFGLLVYWFCDHISGNLPLFERNYAELFCCIEKQNSQFCTTTRMVWQQKHDTVQIIQTIFSSLLRFVSINFSKLPCMILHPGDIRLSIKKLDKKCIFWQMLYQLLQGKFAVGGECIWLCHAKHYTLECEIHVSFTEKSLDMLIFGANLLRHDAQDWSVYSSCFSLAFV